MAASSIAADLYTIIKERIKEFSTQTGTHPKLVMSKGTFNELSDTLKELEYNGAGHYLREFMQVEGCSVIIDNRIGGGTFELTE
jgi:hypothetical protein